MPQTFPKPRISIEELTRMLEEVQFGDPMADTAPFETFERSEAIEFMKGMGISVAPIEKESDEVVRKKLRHALWDSQRLDLMFPGKTFDVGLRGNINPDTLPSWPKWREPRSELQSAGLGPMMVDGYSGAERLDSYVSRHFQMSAFTQQENMRGIYPKAGMAGAWDGIRTTMSKAVLDITRDGGDKIPIVAYHTESGKGLLIVEILDVKQAKWSEPTAYETRILKTAQRVKFRRDSSEPLVPMLQTPKFPIVIVRYHYLDSKPKKGSLLTGHVQQKLQATLGVDGAQKAVQFHLGCSEEVAEDHLRALTRILDANSDLLDTDYVDEHQSHWKGVTTALTQQTRISFFSPCLRLRWRALEEVETGQKITKLELACAACGKKVAKPVRCGGCKATIYCNAGCSKANWDRHKPKCTYSARLLEGDVDLPEGKWLVPLRCYHEFTPDSGFASEVEAAIQSGCPPSGECPPDEYGDKRFIVRANMEPRYCVGGLPQYKGKTVFMWDRRRSFLVRVGPGDVEFAEKYKGGMQIPFHRKGYEEFSQLVKQRGFVGCLMMLWAKRIGDSMEIDLVDIPNQNEFYFN